MALELRKVFNIEKEEVSRLTVLLFQSVFLGIFAGTFDVSAQSYFLEIYSADMIPKAFMYSGAVGIVITSIYSFLQSRLRFSVFSVFNLLFVAILTISLRLGFVYYGNEKLVFVMFVLMGPLTIISFLGFWGTVSRLFTLRQGKRLFGIVDTGQIMGIIIASYAIPLLLRFNFKILNSLYICFISIILALIIQLIISSKYSLKIQEDKQEKAAKRSNFFDLFRDKYTFLMVVFVALSVFAAFFIHFSFLVVTEENYQDPTALASFLGVFMGTVMVITLIIKTFVYSRLINTYGLKVALLLSPVILGIFVIGALVVGSTFGYSAASSGFTLFFLLIVSGKLFAKSLKDSVEVPSSKILYQSLDASERFNVQSRIDGTVNELAAFSSGLLLAGLATINAVSQIHFTSVLIGILIVWIFVAFLLHKSYKNSLKKSLAQFKKVFKHNSDLNKIEDKVLKSSDEINSLYRILSYTPQIWDGFVTKNLKLLLTGSDKLQTSTLKLVDKLNIAESQNLLIENEARANSDLRENFRVLIERFNYKKSEYNHESVTKLAMSDSYSNKLKALTIISKSPEDEWTELLQLILKDTDPRIIIPCIRLIGKEKRLNFTERLIDMLEDENYYAYAYNALKMFSSQILDRLNQAFYRSNASIEFRGRIIRLMARSDNREAIPMLLSKLDQPELFIHLKLFTSLVHLDYKPDVQMRLRLNEYLYKLIGIIAWNISIKYSLKIASFSQELIFAIDEEITESFDNIFLMLSVIYDSKTIVQIRNNFEAGTGESIGYSIELLDLFIDESIKSNLFAVLEDSSEISKIQKLQSEYPVEVLKGEKLLNAIINRDYNFIHPYTRILAIEEAGNYSKYKIGNDFISQLFNPDLHIALITATQMIKRNPEDLKSVIPRLNIKRQQEILELQNTSESKQVASEKAVFEALRNNIELKEFSFRSLYALSVCFKELEYVEGQSINLDEKFGSEGFLYVSKGKAVVSDMKGTKKEVEGQNFSTLLANEKITIEKEGKIWFLSADHLRKLIFDNEEIFLPALSIFFNKQNEL